MDKKETHFITPRNNINAYQLRNIPKDLWDAAKHKAIEEGTSVRMIILKALEKYLHRT